MTFSATAAPATAKKQAANGGKRAIELTAKTRPVQNQRFHVATSRSIKSVQTPSLHKAMKATHIAGKKAQAALHAAATLPNLKGMVTYQDGWTSETAAPGLYTLGADGVNELMFTGPEGYSGIAVEGVYYTNKLVDFLGMFQWYEIHAYDIESGEEIASNSEVEFTSLVYAYAVDPTTGDVYGIGYNTTGDGLMLAKHNFSIEGTEAIDEVIPVANLEGNWNSLVCDAQGQLYGISYEMAGQTCTSSTLCKIDKATGAVTTIGVTGQLPQYLSGATIDPKTNVMYWAVSSPAEDGFLCTVDLTTGAATKIVEFDLADEVQGLYVANPLAEAGAPAAVENVVASFPDGGLTGTVSFTAPATLFDGTAATGALAYSVLANGEEVATGETTFGAEVVADVTLPASGTYTFQVTVSNEAGKSPAAKTSTFVGFGVPEATTATLVYEDGKMKLSWTPVTATVDGGYINAEAVTYTVTRFPGAEVVAENTSATECEEAVEAPESITQYFYTVVAHSNGLNSATAKSNTVTLGSVVPPYTNDFSADNSLDGFTILDENGDGRAWTLNDGQVRMMYNMSMDMDDWLISPPLKLEAGKAYYVSAKLRGMSKNYAERFEMKWGNAATVDAMTGTIVPATEILSSDFAVYGDYIVPATSGIFYVGIHGISDADMYYLYVDDFSVAAGMAQTAPAEATDVVITPDPNGEFKAEISFKAPAVAFSGAALTDNLTKVEVSRGGEVVKTFTDVAPGAELSFTDVLEEGGDVTYTIQAYNADGAGQSVTATAFIGVDQPAAPENVNITETATPGEVIVTWDEVTTDTNGNPINPALVSYFVCEYVSGSGWAPVHEDPIAQTSYTYQAVPAGEQDFVQVCVFAVTDGGEDGTPSDMIAAGTPYPFMEESFANGTLNYILGVEVSDDYDVAWDLYDDSAGVPAQDGDNGFLGLKGSYLNDSGSFWTGKIDLSGKVNPGVSFYTYNMALTNQAGDEADDTNTIEVFVKKAADTEWTALTDALVISELGERNSWVPVNASLAAYAGEVVQVRVKATVNAAAYTLFDNFKVGDMLAQDLAATGVTAPAKVKVGFDYNVAVKVANVGTEDAGAFTIKLFADAEEVASKEVESLAAGKNLTETFALTMSALATEPVELYAEVVYTADENTANNTSALVSVAPQTSNLPGVTDLSGKEGAEGIELTWSEPDLSAAPADAETVDFEDGDAWAHEYANWVFIDGDESPVGGFQDSNIPGIDPGTTTASFFVFDAADETVVGAYAQSFKAHSGDKYLAAMFRYDDGTTDDWAISPTLDGSAQTISFFAQSYSTQYPEKIEVYYSLGGIELTDFVKVDGVGGTVPGDWTEYTFDVPAGATHFAVRSCGTSSFMLMLDDFTFTAAGAAAELSLVGYDVYRDGVKINGEPTGETEFVDGEATIGNHTYVVVTVYDKGISAPSNAVTVVATGISEIEFNANDNAEYYNMQGIRVLNPEKGGLYIRKQDGKASKVAVK